MLQLISMAFIWLLYHIYRIRIHEFCIYNIYIQYNNYKLYKIQKVFTNLCVISYMKGGIIMCIRVLSRYERLTRDKKEDMTKKLIKAKMGAIENIKNIEDIYDIETFKKSIEIIEEQYKNIENKSIFHYTSAEGLKSIIENKQIWFSKTDFLNDKDEIKHTYDLIENIIGGTRLLETRGDKELNKEIEEFKGYLDKALLGEGNSFNRVNSYSASFSMNGDSNLLWEGYSKDDGYNIEFNSNAIYSIVCDVNKLNLDCICIAHTVIYEEEEQINLLKNEVIDIYKIFKYCKKFDKLEEFENLISSNISNIVVYSLFFKSAEFKPEDEYRIIMSFVDDTIEERSFKIRVKNGAFIPYKEVLILKNTTGVNEMPINSITISPKNNLDIVENGIDYLLKLNNVEGIHEEAKWTNKIKIKKSEIPYRY